MRTTAPPTAIPAIAPVGSAPLGDEVAVALVVGDAEAVEVVTARVAVRTEIEALRVIKTGRSRSPQPAAGVVTVAPPRAEPPTFAMISDGTTYEVTFG